MTFAISRFYWAALATIALSGVGLSVADAAKPLPSFFGSQAISRRPQELAPLIGPNVIGPGQFFRQRKTGVCADQGGMVICAFTFVTVGEKRALRINNVSCGGPVDAGNVIQFFILTTSPDFAALKPVAVIPAKQTIDLGGGGLLIVANETGPYYFAAGETVYILSGGSLQSPPTCMISGTMLSTD